MFLQIIFSLKYFYLYIKTNKVYLIVSHSFQFINNIKMIYIRKKITGPCKKTYNLFDTDYKY